MSDDYEGLNPNFAALCREADQRSKPRKPSANDGAALGYSWQLIWHGEAVSADARKWLVQDLLPETGVALISGQWGTYKTFVADDLCAAVMTAATFANKQVMRKGGVLFFACEGQNEVNIRLTAAFKKHGGTGNAPFAWVQGCPRLLDPNAGKILAAMVKHAAAKMMQEFELPVAMVVIDTAGKAAGLSKPGELNDDAVAKVIMSALADASTETGALFVGVAHFGKNVETGTKGSSGFEDDADAVLALLGERGVMAPSPTQSCAHANAVADLTAKSSPSKPRKQKSAPKRPSQSAGQVPPPQPRPKRRMTPGQQNHSASSTRPSSTYS